MIVICTNEVAGPTGYHKSVVQLANGLRTAGYPVAVLGFLGTGDVASRMLPRWPLDLEVPAYTLRSLPAAGGSLLHKDVHPQLSGALGALRYEFTANELAALRDLNRSLSDEDTIIFTAPVQALAFQRALGDDERRPRTVLQIHGDYLHHAELWEPLMSVRGTVDRLQTVADGLRKQFSPSWDEDDVVFIPNFPGEGSDLVTRAEHEGVNIALPASFQHRKNQLDAIRALSLIEDESVRLTLWGNISPLNPYFIAVQELIETLGLSHRVSIPGFGTEQDVYSTADIVLMTSLSEGFPYPLLEAMYQSRPTVSYDFEFGPREAIEDGGSGFIVPLGDVEQLADRLRELAADDELREQYGRRARERFDQWFAPAAVAEQYSRFLGPSDRSIDLTEVFATDGVEPVAVQEISHRVRRVRGRRIHQVTVHSGATLHDVEIDDGRRVTRPQVLRRDDRTVIEFPIGSHDVVSYSTRPGSTERHYLAGPADGEELPVLPRLRRDATYGDGTPPVQDTIFASSGGARHVSLRTTPAHLAEFGASSVEAVSWKLRQVLPSPKPKAPAGVTEQRIAAAKADAAKADAAKADAASPAAAGADTSAAGSDASSAPAAAPSAPAGAASTAPVDAAASQASAPPALTGVGKAVGLPAQAMGSVGRVAKTYAKTAASMLVDTIAHNPPAPTRREITRHPWFPVTAGVDSFGTPINHSGGVEVSNSGTAQRPTVTVQGEYDSLVLRDGISRREVSPPWTYGELFESICEAEREHGLFDITSGGVHVWELGRSALVIQLGEAAGLWGTAAAIGAPVRDVYTGSKRLTTAPSARTVVFDYARRGQSGYRTAPFVDDQTLFVVQPDAEGYPGVDETNLVYPFAEFTQWKKHWRRRWSHLRVPEVDARPFEAALSETLGIRVDLGDHLRNRLAKFLAEREFWTPVFERVAPEEVLLASSHWWAGIAAAADRSGARVSDIQYALTSRYAPSFWFGQKPHYGATRFYTWSDYWAERTNVYEEHVVVPREQPELTEAIANPSTEEPVWDVCIVSQPRVLRRILAFVQDLVRERPELRVVLAPHPAQRDIIDKELAAAGLDSHVTVAAEDTLTTIRRSAMSVGTFSTSLWESAAMGCPTYVIEVPGYEETLEDIESGLFRLARTPHDLVPYEVPASRHRIFG
ncbi:glycosyl transferase family 1 [Brachybacterium ginsengisoli]|uniref:Glycosyl transferase family 1 n=1 Tax=Brachybacterium ginsengisoli TaxID=1331682 RepID=A0A291GW14_9MICO|nr:glycosyltransferase family 4 protein [Brachybacterium ginsengisoli]ATG54400.1 glycosyl transferase family 1 [Brachybacterium ginsengisoli]